MNWNRTRMALANGKRVKRPHWITCLYQHAGQILWDITGTLASRCNDDGSEDRTYQPQACDVDANDWQVAT